MDTEPGLNLGAQVHDGERLKSRGAEHALGMGRIEKLSDTVTIAIRVHERRLRGGPLSLWERARVRV
jgi:hypothetical protein